MKTALGLSSLNCDIPAFCCFARPNQGVRRIEEFDRESFAGFDAGIADEGDADRPCDFARREFHQTRPGDKVRRGSGGD